MHSFHGPFLIVGKVSAVNYAVCSTRDKKKRIDHVHVCNLKSFIPRTLIPNSLPFPSISCDPVSTTGGVIAEGVRGLAVSHPDIKKIAGGVIAEGVSGLAVSHPGIEKITGGVVALPNPISTLAPTPRLIYGNLRSGHQY